MNSKQAASWPDATVLLTKSGRRANNLTLKKEKKKSPCVTTSHFCWKIVAYCAVPRTSKSGRSLALFCRQL